MAATTSPVYHDKISTGGEAVYHELAPKIVLAIRCSAVITVLMVIFTFISCLAQGTKHHRKIYLLAANILVSSFVGLVHGWWYRNGDLGSEKYWFMFMTSIVICLQCIMIDVFVFNYPQPLPPAPTLGPSHNITTTATALVL